MGFQVYSDRDGLHLEARPISSSCQTNENGPDALSLTGTNQILIPDASNCVTQTPPPESAKGFPELLGFASVTPHPQGKKPQSVPSCVPVWERTVGMEHLG